MVMINGHALYFHDTVSIVAQVQANHLISLLVGLPLLVVSGWLAVGGSLRGRLLLAGTLAFSSTPTCRWQCSQPTTRCSWCMWRCSRYRYRPPLGEPASPYPFL